MRDNYLWDKLAEHFGHDVRISVYGDVDDPADVCLECEDCNEVILDAELYTLRARSGIEPELPIERHLKIGALRLPVSTPCSAAASCWRVWPKKPRSWLRPH